jgi:hypothetical protein
LLFDLAFHFVPVPFQFQATAAVGCVLHIIRFWVPLQKAVQAGVLRGDYDKVRCGSLFKRNLTVVILVQLVFFGMLVDITLIWQKRNPIRSILRMT